jgi:Rnl2 family RNA ligase
MLKYHSLLNSSFNRKYWSQIHPNLDNIEYVAQQKYDGSNIQIEFGTNKAFRLFTRNQELGGNGDFHGLRELLKTSDYSDLIDKIQNWLDNSIHKKINLYGEFYGPGIQKRINYGNIKQLKFFDVLFDEKIQTVFNFKNWMTQLGLERKLVECLLVDFSLDNLITNGLEMCTKLVSNNKIEGIVIKPYNIVLIDNNKTPFFIKIKTKEFNDIESPKKKIMNTDLEADISSRLSKYITDNRIQDCRGKQLWTNYGDFLKIFIEDINDELKKNQASVLEKNEHKLISKLAFEKCEKLFDIKSGLLL